ncbi:MAG: two-component system response regulator [gamma proteobacterium symbiont of Bathyaustriella thionipta]|nr:two-component system response regulator [gamma proteobacterium symbiont of Bathyaustriella thionipta]
MSTQQTEAKDTILMVDDNPANLQVLSQTLDGQGYKLLAATSGEQAIRTAVRVVPQLLLLDIMMPGLDGFEVIDELSRHKETHDIPVIFLSALDDTESKVKGLEKGAVDYISKPFQPEEVIARVQTHLQLNRLKNNLAESNRALHDLNEHLEEKVCDRTQQIVRGRDALIFALARLAEARDSETGRHLERMQVYSAKLAQYIFQQQPELNLSKAWVKHVERTAVLHDIGKIGIPDHILLKPGKLTDDERGIMQQHAEIGGKALHDISEQWGTDGFLMVAAEIALGHHEKWDGSGYPYGKSGQDIPLAARIVALADVYDALTSKRPYKEAWNHQQAVDYICSHSGSHFDPQLVEAFNQLIPQFAEIAARMHGNSGTDPSEHLPEDPCA